MIVTKHIRIDQIVMISWENIVVYYSIMSFTKQSTCTHFKSSSLSGNSCLPSFFSARYLFGWDWQIITACCKSNTLKVLCDTEGMYYTLLVTLKSNKLLASSD